MRRVNIRHSFSPPSDPRTAPRPTACGALVSLGSRAGSAGPVAAVPHREFPVVDERGRFGHAAEATLPRHVGLVADAPLLAIVQDVDAGGGLLGYHVAHCSLRLHRQFSLVDRLARLIRWMRRSVSTGLRGRLPTCVFSIGSRCASCEPTFWNWLLCCGTEGRNAMGYMTEERRLIQETARAFAMKEVLPLANKLDPEKGDIPPELIQKLADMGYFGIVIPEQYGGLGLGVFEYCLITEELARAWMSVASDHRPRQRPFSAGRGMTEAQRARLPAARRPRRVPGRGGDVGARCRLGPRQHLLPRPQRRRRLGDQRQQILVHLRRRRRLHHAGGAHLRSARSQAQACRPVVLPDREAARHAAGRRQGRADPQDRLFRLEDLGARLRRLPPARRLP